MILRTVLEFPLSLMSVSLSWHIPPGEIPSHLHSGHWGKSGLCQDPGHTRQHLCFALDCHCHVLLFCQVSWTHSQCLSDLKGTGRGTTNTLLYLKTDYYSFASRWLTDSRLFNYLPGHFKQLPRAEIQSLTSPVLRFANRKMEIYLRWNLFLISLLQMCFPVKAALAAMSA